MTTPLHRHLSPDDLDLVLDGAPTPALRSHLAACPTCDALVRHERAIVRALEHLPRHVPAAGFEERVMARVLVAPPLPVFARLAQRVFGSPRAAALAASLLIGLVGLLGGSLAWSVSHQAELLALKALVVDEGARLLWTSLQSLASTLLEQPWYGTLRAAAGSPARLAGLAAGLLVAYAGGLLALRRLLAAPLRRVAHEHA